MDATSHLAGSWKVESHRCSRECKGHLMCSMEWNRYKKHFKVGKVTKCLVFIGEKHLIRVWSELENRGIFVRESAVWMEGTRGEWARNSPRKLKSGKTDSHADSCRCGLSKKDCLEMWPSALHVCGVRMSATDLFTYNTQSVLVQCFNNYKPRWESFTPEALQVLDLVSLSQDCHKEPCCNPVACHQQNAAQSKPCARVMASILLLSTGCEVAMSAAVISGLENLHADEIILSSVRKVCVQGVCRDLQCSVLYSTSTYHLQ